MIARTVVPAVALALLPLIWVSAESAGDILLLGAAGASWAFTLLYLARSPWWTRHVGRMLVAFTLALSLVLTQNAVGTWWGESYPYRGEIRDVLYAALAVTLTRFALALYGIQRR
ncbi:putative phage holin [Mycobacteroides abscessus]|uniref:putative phage holin n=1 Tax=Mycobacteroides abscessus TaxID=36809 RepID=UPI000C260756|nr:hypothetical protein [Mycobacteroides abscessus]